MYIVIKVDKKNSSRIDELYKEDLVSRQSIVRREGISLGLNDDFIYVLVEGSERGVEKAKEIASDFATIIPQKEMEEIYRRFKEQDESSLEGMGSIFG